MNWRRILLFLACLSYFWGLYVHVSAAGQADDSPTCDQPGWFPEKFGLKDHAVFWYDGYYYIISTYVSPISTSPLLQDRFAYARSQDFCTWEELEPVLTERTPGSWDEAAIWAPFVYYEDGIYFLYYTGVTQNWTQSIMLATSTDPSDPHSWQTQEMVFHPNHDHMVWKVNQAADCRDPFLLKLGDVYYLYYTGRDEDGGIIGFASAPTPLGPWKDWGSILPPVRDEMLESPFIVQRDGYYFLFYNISLEGEYYQVSEFLYGGWGEMVPFSPGWAHEFWQSVEGDWYTSYLTDYSVTINGLTWVEGFDVPQPRIEWARAKIYLPMIPD